MKLHELSSTRTRTVQRVGRGGKRGTTSGRGTKGQRSRAGHRIRPALRDLIIRLPKRRGFRNKPKSEKPFVVDLGAIAKAVGTGNKGSVITRSSLQSMKLIPAGYKGDVKILGKATLQMPLTIKGITVSQSVASQITAAGGKIE